MLSSLFYDYVIAGSGIVGLTVAYELKKRFPTSSICILEKESSIGFHASGRNSGVLHSGIYYANDTLKARYCASGAVLMRQFADTYNIPYKKSGKVILANSESDLPTVDKLLNNAQLNGINAYSITKQDLKKIEPYATFGSAAIFTPDTSVIDSSSVLKKLYDLLVENGVDFFFSTLASYCADSSSIITSNGAFSFTHFFNCAGSYSDQIAHQFDVARHLSLVPFKGIYWQLSESAAFKVNSNIYPIPDISIPFLGVHATRVYSDKVFVGPTAIPAFSRENYSMLDNLSFNESSQILSHILNMYISDSNNFRALAHKEFSMYFKSNFLKSVQCLVPSITLRDLVPTPKVGIRPQLIDITTKALQLDFVIRHTPSSTHVLNSISPAFTCSFSFAKVVVDQANLS